MFVLAASLKKSNALHDVLATAELWRRTPRERDLATEADALRSLAENLRDDPEQMLRSLVDQSITLCGAQTAGLSMVRTDANGTSYFSWDCIRGVLAHCEGGSTPIDHSPCGVTLSHGSPQLFRLPGRYFHYFLDVDPQIVEGLVVPVVVANRAIATIWIVRHDDDRPFTNTEVEVMSSLASFTGAALRLMSDPTRPRSATA